jgi:hypothetical protein
VHRIGKEKQGGNIADDTTLVNGFSTVRSVTGRIFAQTPEFKSRFVYKYLPFWSCAESPFIWDGNEGDSFCFGLAEIRQETIVRLFSPVPGPSARKENDSDRC